MEILIKSRLTWFPPDSKAHFFYTAGPGKRRPEKSRKESKDLNDTTLLESFMLSQLELLQLVASDSSNAEIFWKELNEFLENEVKYFDMPVEFKIFRYFKRGTSIFACFNSIYRELREADAVLEFRENRDFPIDDCAEWVCRNYFASHFNPKTAETIQGVSRQTNPSFAIGELKGAIFYELGLPEIENELVERFRYDPKAYRTTLSIAVFRVLSTAW